MILTSLIPWSARRYARVGILALLATAGGLVSLPATTAGADPLEPAEGPAHGKEILVVKESGETKTIDAKGQDLTVTGNRNKLTVTGECHALTISGDLNFVSVEAVASISMSGGGNEVAYQKAVDGEKPQITSTGKDNVAAKKKVE
jgi:hypothetical protein